MKACAAASLMGPWQVAELRFPLPPLNMQVKDGSCLPRGPRGQHVIPRVMLRTGPA